MNRTVRGMRAPLAVRGNVAIAICAAAFLTGCAAGLGGGSGEVDPAAPREPARQVGVSLMNEPCEASLRRARPGDRVDELPLEILCAGVGDRAAATVFVSAASAALLDPATRREALERASRFSTIARDIGQRLACQPGRAASLDGIDIVLSACTQKAGNLPAMTMVAVHRGQFLLVEGAPSLVPVMLAGLRLRAGDSAEQIAVGPDTRAAVDALLAEMGVTAAAQVPLADLLGFQEQQERARLANSTQSYAEAEEALRRALDVQSRLLPQDDPGIGETLTQLGLEVSNQGRFAEAESLFRRAEPIVQRSVRQEEYATLLSYMAMHAANQRNFQRALTMMRDVTARRRSSGSQGGIGSAQSGLGDLAHGLLHEAAFAVRLNRVDEAEEALTEARRMIEGNNTLPPWWRAMVAQVAGEVSVKRGELPAAERALTSAVDLRRGLFGRTWPTATAIVDLGRFYSQANRMAEAVVTYREAFAIIAEESGRKPDVTFEQIVPFLLAGAGLGEAEPAQREALIAEMFRANQLTRDGVAGQTIAQTTARLATDDPKVSALLRDQQEVGRERDSLQLELAAEVARPNDRRDRAREAELRARLQAAVQRTEALEREIQVAFPGYDKLVAPKAVEIDEVRRRLDPGEALALFAFGRDIGFGFLVKPDRVLAVPIQLTETELTQTVNELRKAFLGRGGRVGVFDAVLANELYQDLFGGFGEAMADVRHLIVVPAGPMASLPPALLVTERPPAGGEVDYDQIKFLVRDVATSVAPSVRAFVDLRGLRGRARAPRPFVGFGDPTFQGPGAVRAGQAVGLDALSEDCRAGAPLNPALLRSLEPLPETADEVRRIAQLLRAGPDAVVLGEAVNDATIRQRELGQYRVLYFATHGLLPGELRCQGEPGLALSPPRTPPQSVEEDGLLSTSKIARLRLNADLVVLSACNTGGSGGKLGGGALSGLAESFFYAGARSLFVSHWQVPSLETVALTTGMFERLGPELDRAAAEALRGSQLAMLERARGSEKSHPFFWAAFTLVGEAGQPGGTKSAKGATSVTGKDPQDGAS